jgi:ABC-2 type transport system ATP-binding protein
MNNDLALEASDPAMKASDPALKATDLALEASDLTVKASGPTVENTDLAIEASGLVKSYRDVAVLAGVDLRIPRGHVFALLGPNGAGKTTTVRILATLTEADAGQARVAGFDVRRDRSAVRRRISLTGQFAALDEAQTGQENLHMMARLARLSRPAARRRAGELIEQFDLTAAARRRVGTYSGGMRRRLDIAASLVGRPSVIFLDEPSTGLDPQSRRVMWGVVEDLAAGGVTVFLTTQYLEEAERLAETIAVLNSGRVIAQGTAAELKQRVAAQRLDLTCANAAAFHDVSRYFGDRAIHRDQASLTLGVPTDGSAAQVRALLDAADPARVLVASFAVRGASLDDVFLTLTQHDKARETAHV